MGQPSNGFAMQSPARSARPESRPDQPTQTQRAAPPQSQNGSGGKLTSPPVSQAKPAKLANAQRLGMGPTASGGRKNYGDPSDDSPPALIPNSAVQNPIPMASSRQEPDVVDSVGVLDCNKPADNRINVPVEAVQPPASSENNVVAVTDITVLDSIPPNTAILANIEVVNIPPPKQEVKFASALESGTDKKDVKLANDGSLYPGARIEFCYNGDWLPGELKSIDGDSVQVICDVDREANLATNGPLSLVRPAKSQVMRAAPPGMINQQELLQQGYAEEPQQTQTVAVQETIQPVELPVVQMAVGERVLLWYDQQWLPGTLASFGEDDNGIVAYVRCDCDGDANWATKAPLNMIRTMTTEDHDQDVYALPG